jgi:hypothetical protein
MNATIVLKSAIHQMYDQLQAYDLDTSFKEGVIEIKFEGSSNPYWGCSIEQNSDGSFRLKSMALSYPIDRTVTNQNLLGVISFLSGQEITKKSKTHSHSSYAEIDDISDLVVEYNFTEGSKSTFKGTWELPADEDEANEVEIIDIKWRGISVIKAFTSKELETIEGKLFTYQNQ